MSISETVYAVRKGDVAGEYAVSGGKTDVVTAVAAEDCTAFVAMGDKAEISVENVVNGLCAPISAGDVIGEAVVYINGEKYKSVPLVATNDCEKKGYLDILDDFIEEW